MIKIRIEDTDINETFEYEGDGIVFAIPHIKNDGIGVLKGAQGKFNIKVLKGVQKSLKKLFKHLYKGEGRIE